MPTLNGINFTIEVSRPKVMKINKNMDLTGLEIMSDNKLSVVFSHPRLYYFMTAYY